jgi:hypothetical protein
MIAEKLADEIRREAKAGSVEHSALNSRLGANVCIWQILLQKSAIAMVRLRRRFSGTVFLSRRV